MYQPPSNSVWSSPSSKSSTKTSSSRPSTIPPVPSAPPVPAPPAPPLPPSSGEGSGSLSLQATAARERARSGKAKENGLKFIEKFLIWCGKRTPWVQLAPRKRSDFAFFAVSTRGALREGRQFAATTPSTLARHFQRPLAVEVDRGCSARTVRRSRTGGDEESEERFDHVSRVPHSRRVDDGLMSTHDGPALFAVHFLQELGFA